LKVIANRDMCVSGAQCVLYAPEVFDQDEEGTVVVLRDEVGQDELEAVDGAVMMCPGRALRVERG
jgi:ferredoxin